MDSVVPYHGVGARDDLSLIHLAVQPVIQSFKINNEFLSYRRCLQSAVTLAASGRLGVLEAGPQFFAPCDAVIQEPACLDVDDWVVLLWSDLELRRTLIFLADDQLILVL